MAFKEMIAKLKAEGYLDENNKLTQKGHDLAEQYKQDYDANIKPFSWQPDPVVAKRTSRQTMNWNLSW